ncbi:hypothetical protein A3D85_02660 [Candidatus Amesbacteria bacterium RIFCSPHIGHO2_02_FULL_47_9]|nr:MAG: hypothetical protein A3D85_02660 [Candidatus Amesbacteria bacterium RIFCSPHIGHO2_02_FULL_47_9]
MANETQPTRTVGDYVKQREAAAALAEEQRKAREKEASAAMSLLGPAAVGALRPGVPYEAQFGPAVYKSLRTS